MADLRLAGRTLAAVAAATFLAGAAVSLRLHLRLPEPLDWAAIGGQGLERTWFALFAGPAVLAATALAGSWPAFAGRRAAVGVMAYAIAFAMFVFVLAPIGPEAGLDPFAHLYLLSGSLAGAAAGRPVARRPSDAGVPSAA